MKIVHIIIDLDVGGAELMLRRLVEADATCPTRRHLIVSLTDLGTVGRAMRENGVQIYTLAMRTALDAPMALIKLVHLLKVHKPDIVQTWMYHSDLLGGIAARLAGIRNVAWGIRSTRSAPARRSTRVVMRLCAALSHWVPKVIICCAEAARRHHADLGYRRDILKVIPNGYSLPAQDQAAVLSELRVKWGVPDGFLIVGTAARFHPLKDFKNLISAAAQVARRRRDVWFVLAGRGVSSENAQLASWIEQSGCGSSFTLLGERTDIAQVMSTFNVYCLSSRTEGFPNSVAEAMALGVPCVVTDVGDAALLVGETGVVVPPQDSEALAEGILRVLNMPREERESLGCSARDRLTTEFSMNEVLAKYIAAYSAMTANLRG